MKTEDAEAPLPPDQHHISDMPSGGKGDSDLVKIEHVHYRYCILVFYMARTNKDNEERTHSPSDNVVVARHEIIADMIHFTITHTHTCKRSQ